jgi:hypothetical protein
MQLRASRRADGIGDDFGRQQVDDRQFVSIHDSTDQRRFLDVRCLVPG